MKTAFIVRETRGHWIRDFAAAVRAAGLRAELVTEPLDDAERAELGALVDGFVVVEDVRDVSAVAEAIRARDPGPAGVVTAAEGIIASTARVAELLGVARCPASVFTLAHNKYAVRRLLAEAGLPGPRAALFADPAEAASVAERVGLPAIVKPVNGAASTLVRTVSTVDELVAAHELLATRLPENPDARYHRPLPGGLDPRRVFLVEGLLDGPEYAVDVLIRDGVVEPVEIVGKPLVDERKFELVMVSPPFGLAPERAELVTQAVADAVRALGLDNTSAHVEVIDDAVLGPAIVEINAGRPVGGATALLLKLRTGVDVFAETVALGLGHPPPAREPAALPVPVGELILYASGHGRLVRIDGLDELADLPEVFSVITTVSPGQLLSDDHETYAVNAFVAGFADADDLAALYAEATKLVRFELEEA
ncbi:ATP-grasp domain-containing protein [Amycolatopsis sp. MtRt-6]|uniref:ATP-grasp domain-containing protein n=1 Tax=Amycolatopsis sp. MtRt-6 TaxID=2792782 RepID=UPI001A8C9BB5|nr:ATP-grasp domain-containing protein [Amycolatopsis sp. MtRt-6]